MKKHITHSVPVPKELEQWSPQYAAEMKKVSEHTFIVLVQFLEKLDEFSCWGRDVERRLKN